MKAFNVTTTAQEVSPAGNRDMFWVYNNSDAIIYLKFDGSNVDLTTANGFPLPVGAAINFSTDGSKKVFDKAVWAIHGGSGNKEVRVQGAD